MVRNTLKYVAHKDMKFFAKDLCSIYTAPDEKTALKRLEEADKKWSPHYPAVIQRWYDHWDIITPIFKFSMGVRTAFYTTNIIESLNASYRTNSMGVGLDFASEIFNRIGCWYTSLKTTS